MESIDARKTGWKYQALSQSQAGVRVFTASYILISIQDPDLPEIDLDEPANCRGILRMRFDDIDHPASGQTLFSRDDAAEILDFVQEHAHDVSVIACHCKMGMCRSPAVIGALSMLMTGDASVLKDRRGKAKYRPNRHIYNTMMQIGRSHAISRQNRMTE